MISVNIEKAKIIAHEKRREMRDSEFSPLDEKIAKQIPGIDLQDIEAKRQVVREKYAKVQEEIDSAQTIEQIKSILESNK